MISNYFSDGLCICGSMSGYFAVDAFKIWHCQPMSSLFQCWRCLCSLFVTLIVVCKSVLCVWLLTSDTKMKNARLKHENKPENQRIELTWGLRQVITLAMMCGSAGPLLFVFLGFLYYSVVSKSSSLCVQINWNAISENFFSCDVT